MNISPLIIHCITDLTSHAINNFPIRFKASTKCSHWSFSPSLSLSVPHSWPNLTSLFYQLHFHSKCSLFCCFTCYLNIFIIARILPELRVFSHKVPVATAVPSLSPVALLLLLLLVSLSLEPWSEASRRSGPALAKNRVLRKNQHCTKLFIPHTHTHSHPHTPTDAQRYPRPAFCFGLALMMYALWKELSKVVFWFWWANVDPGNMGSHLSLPLSFLPLSIAGSLLFCLHFVGCIIKLLMDFNGVSIMQFLRFEFEWYFDCLLWRHASLCWASD